MSEAKAKIQDKLLNKAKNKVAKAHGFTDWETYISMDQCVSKLISDEMAIEYARLTQLDLLRNVSKEIIGIKFHNKKRLDTNIDQFYNIMKKYGINQTTTDAEGRTTGNNYEWSICMTLFQSMLSNYVGIGNLFYRDGEFNGKENE